MISPADEVAIKLMDTQPDAVVWFTPIFGKDANKAPIDFAVGYCNFATCRLLGVTKEQLLGEKLSNSALMDAQSRNSIAEQCHEVWKKNEPLEFTYYSASLDKYLNARRSKILDGILSVTRDRTAWVKMEQEKDRTSKLFNELVEKSPYGVCLYETIRDNRGAIVDFRLKVANQKSNEIIAISEEDHYKYTVKELMILRGQKGYFEICRDVVETGKPVYHELYSKGRNQWIGISIVKFGDGYLLNYIDITHTKSLEKQARAQADMLQGVLDASLAGIIVLEPIHGFSGKVLDFRITLSNKSADELMQIKPEEKTKSFLTLFPTAKNNGLFDTYLTVLSGGAAIQANLELKGDRLNGWFTISVSRMGGQGLVQAITQIPSPQKN